MSTSLQCNYCKLKAIRTEAAQSNDTVTTLLANGELNGRNVYVHPKNIQISDVLYHDRVRYFRAWFMEMGEVCSC